jgi:eukaryotic-like serine/threonine-protein kinase
MDRAPFSNDQRPFVRLIRNRYFWVGLTAIAVGGAILYTVFNSFLMPSYTRHGSTLSVPNVLDRTVSEADSVLREAGLTSEQVLLRKPNIARGIILDQNPAPYSSVKPGRRIYLTVNAGDTTTVIVPDVEAVSLREAQNRILSRGLAVAEALPDSFPSPHVKTVTRQSPEAGTRVIPGSEVQLWISTGLGVNQVLVPSVTGMPASEARLRLRQVLLNSVLITAEQDTAADPMILDQSPSQGTSVREGIVVRLRTSRD